MAAVLISLPLAIEPVVGEKPLTRDRGPVQHPGYYGLPSPGFPRYPFTGHPERKDEQLGAGICTQAHRFVVSHANHCTTEMHHENTGIMIMMKSKI